MANKIPVQIYHNTSYNAYELWHLLPIMTNVDQIPKKVLNVKLKGNCPRGRPRSRCEQPVRQDVTQEDSKK